MKNFKHKAKRFAAAALSAAVAASCASAGAGAINNGQLLGDVDGDNQITSADALMVLRMSLGLTAKSGAPSGASFDPADVDGDGSITANDALLILRESVGLQSIPKEDDRRSDDRQQNPTDSDDPKPVESDTDTGTGDIIDTDLPAVEHKITVKDGDGVKYAVYNSYSDSYEETSGEFIEPTNTLRIKALMPHDENGAPLYDSFEISVEGQYIRITTNTDPETHDQEFVIDGLSGVELSLTLYYIPFDYDLDETDTDVKDTDVTDTDVNDTDVTDTDVNDTDVTDTDVNDTDVTDTDTEDSDTEDSDSHSPLVVEPPATNEELITYGINRFSVNLFKECSEDGKNTVLSPLSVYMALAMTQNGADEDTHKELSALLSNGSVSDEGMNKYFSDYMKRVNGGNTLRAANSFFVMERGDIEIQQPFVDTLKTDYFAEVFSGPANRETESRINAWAKDKTDGMIDSILPEGTLNDNAVSVLLNALCFKAEWMNQYYDMDVGVSTFKNYDGTTADREFLSGEEDLYIEDVYATGFVKRYKTPWDESLYEKTGDGFAEDYRFVALLPKDGVSIDEYVDMLGDYRTIPSIVYGASNEPVVTKMPKFTIDSSYGLNDILCKLGIPQAFDQAAANFTKLAKSLSGNVFIDKVLHKAHISLTESGTEAAAVTAIAMADEACPPEQKKEVVLDRPFVYVIYDAKNNIPIFIGTVCDLTESGSVPKPDDTDTEPGQYEGMTADERITRGIQGFSTKLFRDVYSEGENTVLSPLSVYAALAMADNGAANETQEEITSALTAPGDYVTDVGDINSFLKSYTSDISKSSTLKLANSLFLMERDDIEIQQPFVDTLKNDYFAEIFNRPANNETENEINSWCSKNTDGMIDKIIGEGTLTQDTLAVLLNAVCFEAEWQQKYETAEDFSPVEFTNYDGTKTLSKFMKGTEELYIEDGGATGFIKPYRSADEKERYSFIAILPDEDVSVDEYIASMSNSTISNLVSSASNEYEVRTKMPKFKIDTTAALADILGGMGIRHAFDPSFADFSGLAIAKNNDCNVYISDVVHKAHIDVDNEGTKAAAVTEIIFNAPTSIDPGFEPPHKDVVLDRPFIYVIYDDAHDIPVFIGTVCSISE